MEDNNIKVLGDIPLDNDIVNSYCQGTPLMDNNSNFNKDGMGFVAFSKIFTNLKEWIEMKKIKKGEII